MTPATSSTRPRAGAWRAWAHLGALIVLAGAVGVAGSFSGGGGPESLGALLAHLADFYFGALPVLAAISTGMLAFDASTPRHAALLGVATAAAMAGLDLMGGGQGAGGTTSLVLRPGGVVSATAVGDFTSVPLIETLWHLVRDGFALPPAGPGPYEADDPRLLAAFAVLKSAHLLLTIALVGIVLGVQAWVADHVTFNRHLDEVVARIVLAWVFAPAGFYLALSWGRRLCAQVLFGGAPLATPLLPTGVLLVIAAFGWATARRVARWSR